jgi:hypothetical protein
MTTRLGIGSMGLGLAVLLLTGVGGSVTAQPMAPPGGDYKKASEVVGVAEFVPGLGTLYVQPRTLPVGPFLAYDRQGHLVSTVYMIPLKDIQAHKRFVETGIAPGMPVNHVDMVYSGGHSGMPEPHYQLVLWYIPAAQAEALK